MEGWYDFFNWITGTGLKLAAAALAGAGGTAAYYVPKLRELRRQFERDEERLDTRAERDRNAEPRG